MSNQSQNLKRSETFFRGYDNAKLFMQKWEVNSHAATIIFNHGQAEHSDCYHRLINGFQARENGKHFNFI